MAFKFSLEKVLEHRKIQEELAQKDMQEALAFLNQEIKKLNHMKHQIEEARLFIHKLETQGGHNQVDSLNEVHHFIKGQKILVERQVQITEKGQILVEEKRELLRQAAIETKIIEKLKEKKREEYLLKQSLEEANYLDEQTSLRFSRTTRDDEDFGDI